MLVREVKGSEMQNSNLDTVYFVISLPPRRQGGRAWYEVADSTVKIDDRARVIGGTSTAHMGRAISLKKECIKGSFWRNRKARARSRYHEDRAYRAKIRQLYKTQKGFDWSKYEGMYT
jgi:hypothetical protein